MSVLPTTKVGYSTSKPIKRVFHYFYEITLNIGKNNCATKTFSEMKGKVNGERQKVYYQLIQKYLIEEMQGFSGGITHTCLQSSYAWQIDSTLTLWNKG